MATRKANAFKGYDYYIDGELITGDSQIYQAIEKAGGPVLEVTRSNSNAYQELFGKNTNPGRWALMYNDHIISREPLD